MLGGFLPSFIRNIGEHIVSHSFNPACIRPFTVLLVITEQATVTGGTEQNKSVTFISDDVQMVQPAIFQSEPNSSDIPNGMNTVVTLVDRCYSRAQCSTDSSMFEQ